MPHKDLSLSYPASTAYDSCIGSSFLRNLLAKCREEKATPGLVIKKHIAGIKDEVLQLQPSATALSPAYLQAMEHALPDVGFRYALISRQGRPVLFAYFQLYTISGHSFNVGRDKSCTKGILGLFLKLKKVKAIIAGNALRNDTPFYCYDPQAMTSEEALASIAAIADKLAADESATAVILKDMPAITPAAQKMLAAMGFSRPWQDQLMDMPIDPAWHSLQDYIADLGRKYKTRANKILAAGKPLTVKPLDYDEILAHQQQITDLFTGLVAKQSFTLTHGGVNNIAELKRIYGDSFELTGYYHDGRLVAFYSAFINEGDYELSYIGFDYQLNGEYQFYFNILFAGLERAILLHKSELRLGRTSFDAKASLGAKARDTDYLIKIAYLPDVAIKWFAKYFSSLEDAKWKLRNPLKGTAK